METLCDPFTAVPSLTSICISDFIFSTLDSILISLLLLSDLLLFSHVPSQSSSPVLLLSFSILILTFSNLTLTLFYLPPAEVSIAQVASLSCQCFLWLLVLSVYSVYADNSKYSHSSLKSLKLFIFTRTVLSIYQTFILYLTWEANFSFVLKLGTTALILILSIHASFYSAKKNPLLAKPVDSAPYKSASLFSVLTMTWVYPILKLGQTRPIVQEDISTISQTDSALEQNKTLHPYLSALRSSDSRYTLFFCIFKCFFKECLLVELLGTLLVVLDFTTPIFVKLLENYLSSDEPVWRGVALVAYLLLTKLSHTVLKTFHNFKFEQISIHIKTSLSAEVFRKLLEMSPDSSTSYGTILNLVNIDTGQIQTGVTDSLKLILLPFSCVFGFYLLFSSVGLFAGLTSTGIVAVLMVLNVVVGRKSALANKDLMDLRDKRVKSCNEMLQNIRVLKIFNWEVKLCQKVLQEREAELSKQTLILLWFLLSIFLNWGTQDYMAAGVVSTMALSGKTLTPGNVFAGLAVMRVLNVSIFVLPPILNCLVQTTVSLDRMSSYFRSKNREKYVKREGEFAIEINKGNFTWKKQETKEELAEVNRVLKDLSFSVKKGELVAVVGKVAAGKSSLLQALIENMLYISAEDSFVHVQGSIAYCSQEAWIQNKTIRENILFGKEHITEKYLKTIKVCSLSQDLESLIGGDLTEIGEKGINLSGGQKARINIARAVYADADILLLDDPLASLDQYVSLSLFEECILNHLSGKTRLIATNNQQFLSHCDRIIVLKSGTIIQNGSFESLISTPGYFRDEYMVSSSQSQLSGVTLSDYSVNLTEKKLVESEDRETGKISFNVYQIYYKHSGYCAVALGFFIMVLWQGVRMFTDFFLASWTTQTASEQEADLAKNVLIFVLGSIGVNVFILLKTFNSFYAGIRASKKMFFEMIHALSDASISKFYDINPIGRIMNRLTKDVSEMDHNLVYISYWAVTQIFNVLMVVSFCMATVPLIIVSLPFALYLGLKVQKIYLCSSREISRLQSISKSPVSQHFSESLSGRSVIHAFGYSKRFLKDFCKLTDLNTACCMYSTGCYGWVTVYLEFIFDVILAISALVIVCSRDSIDPGLAGVCLIYAMGLPLSVYYLILSFSQLENAMVSVERINSLSQTPPEAERRKNLDASLVNWPSHGEILFFNFSAKYRPDTETVLKDLNFCVKGKEKIGIMGRTGSGKSSVVNSLLRIIEGHQGFIQIDGVDIRTVGLDLLRSRICVILQDPALFSGTLRENIDLNGVTDDESIRKVLEKIGLDLGQDSLDREIRENSLSVGQKQMICIARALVKNGKVVVMDEATASIDYKTDLAVQEVMRERMEDSTVITIAHRVGSVLKNDRVLVLDKGQVAEFGRPEELKERKGLFWSLCYKSEEINNL